MEGKSKEFGEKTNVKVAAEQKTADLNNDIIEEMKPEPATSDPKVAIVGFIKKIPEIMEQSRMGVRISCFNLHVELIIIGISVRIVKDSNELREVKKAIKSFFNNCERKKEPQKGLKLEWYESILDNYHRLDRSSITEEDLRILLKTIDETILARENEDKYQQADYIAKTFKGKILSEDQKKGLDNCPDKQESPFFNIVKEQIRKLNSSSLNIEDAERRSLSIRWKVAVVSEIIASFNPSPKPLLRGFCELISQNDETKFKRYLICVERLRLSRNTSAHKKPNGSEEHHMRFIKDARELFDLLLSIIEPKDDPVYSELFPEIKTKMEEMDKMLEMDKPLEIFKTKTQAECSPEEPADLPKSMTTKPQQENNEDNQMSSISKNADAEAVLATDYGEGDSQQIGGKQCGSRHAIQQLNTLERNLQESSQRVADSVRQVEQLHADQLPTEVSRTDTEEKVSQPSEPAKSSARVQFKKTASTAPTEEWTGKGKKWCANRTPSMRSPSAQRRRTRSPTLVHSTD